MSLYRVLIWLPMLLNLIALPTTAAVMSPELDDAITSANADPGLKHYQDGEAALAGDDLDSAERAFQESVASNSRLPQPLIGLAEVALRRHQRDKAKEWLDKARKTAPNDAEVYLATARYHTAGKDDVAAEASVKEAIKRNPQYPPAHLALADLYSRLGRPSDAITAYRAAITLDADNPRTHYNLGRVLATVGQFTEAETEFKKAAKLAPTFALPRHSLGRIYLMRNQTRQALAEFDAALTLDPTFLDAILDKGDMLLERGDTEGALSLFERAVEVRPLSALAHSKRGLAFQILKRPTEARQAYMQAITLDSAFAPAYNNLAWLEVESSGTDLNQAAQWAATAVKLAPEVAAYRDTQGWVYRAQRQYAEAETVLEKAATMKPPVADIKYHLGVVYLEQRKLDQARRAFSEALAIDPKHAASKAAIQKLGDAS